MSTKPQKSLASEFGGLRLPSHKQVFPESRLEFEKNRGTCRIVATGWAALGFAFALGVMLAVPLAKFLEHSLLG